MKIVQFDNFSFKLTKDKNYANLFLLSPLFSRKFCKVGYEIIKQIRTGPKLIMISVAMANPEKYFTYNFPSMFSMTIPKEQKELNKNRFGISREILDLLS